MLDDLAIGSLWILGDEVLAYLSFLGELEEGLECAVAVEEYEFVAAVSAGIFLELCECLFEEVWLVDGGEFWVAESVYFIGEFIGWRDAFGIVKCELILPSEVLVLFVVAEVCAAEDDGF